MEDGASRHGPSDFIYTTQPSPDTPSKQDSQGRMAGITDPMSPPSREPEEGIRAAGCKPSLTFRQPYSAFIHGKVHNNPYTLSFLQVSPVDHRVSGAFQRACERPITSPATWPLSETPL